MMPRLREFYPFISRDREGPHEYAEYLAGDEPSPEEYTTKAPLEAYRSRPPSEIPIPLGGGVYIATPGEVSGGPILRAGGIDERIAELKRERIEIEEETAKKAKRTAEYRAETARLLGKEKPPEKFLSPFHPAFKAEFEKKLFAAIEKRHGIPGGNPHTMNIMDMVERISTERLPKLWETLTNNQVRWEDRETIKENFPKIWNNWIRAITQDRKSIETDLKTRQASAIKDYEYNMGKLDTMVKTARANLIEQRKLRQEALKPPAQDIIWDPGTGQFKIFEWDAELQKMVFTGKYKKPPEKPKEEKPEKPEYKTGQALEKIAAAQRAKATFNKTGKIDAIMAKMFPEYTEGQKLSKPEISKVNRAYDRLIKHLEGFAPQLSKREQAINQLQNAGQPVTEANIKFIMDQL